VDDQGANRKGGGSVMTNEAPKRFRFRFSLRILLFAVTILAIWLGWNVYQVRQRKRMELYVVSVAAAYEKNPAPIVYGPPLKPWKSLPIMWRILGTKSVQEVNLTGYKVAEEDTTQIRKWFPEADIRF
jgi:hypothetical protein